MTLGGESGKPVYVQLPELSGHSRKAYALGFNCDGSMLASGSNDRSIRIWNPASVRVNLDSCRHLSRFFDVLIC